MVSGEQVNYTYDALNRLAAAQTSPNSSVIQWGQSFTYDGFGNLTNVTATAGSAPQYSANPSTRRTMRSAARTPMETCSVPRAAPAMPPTGTMTKTG
jgi:hypothetical protein